LLLYVDLTNIDFPRARAVAYVPAIELLQSFPIINIVESDFIKRLLFGLFLAFGFNSEESVSGDWDGDLIGFQRRLSVITSLMWATSVALEG
jgi:hypothetical protein